MFSNKHLNLCSLRRQKVNLESILTEGKYKGKTFLEVLRADLKYATYLGDEVNSNWTWPVLVEWKKLMFKDKYKAQNAIDKTKSKIGLSSNSYFKFGKYKGKKIATIKKQDPSYIEWLNKETKYKIH